MSHHHDALHYNNGTSTDVGDSTEDVTGTYNPNQVSAINGELYSLSLIFNVSATFRKEKSISS